MKVCRLLKLYFILFFSSFSFLLFAQGEKPKPEDFRKSGDAIFLGKECFQLTPDAYWRGGSIWHKKAIDLRAPFEMELEVSLGCNDQNGADGMVFVFHTEASYTGYKGEGIGFAGLMPSIGIEFDTYYNAHLGDPTYDHVAIMANGRVRHSASLMGPVGMRSDQGNVEDCQEHTIEIRWNPARKVLTVFFDGAQRLQLRKDLLKDIFRNNPKIYWGITAATGGKRNNHQVCFEKLVYELAVEKTFDWKTSKKLLKGDVLALDRVKFESGKTDLQPLSAAELDKLVDLLKKNPEMGVSVFSHTDAVGDAANNKVLSGKRAKSVEDYLIEQGIDKDRIFTYALGEEYPIASNATSVGRLKNRRIEIHVARPVP